MAEQPKTKRPIWIIGGHNFSNIEKGPNRYKITLPSGKTIKANLTGRKAQMIATLANGPVYCASTVRLSDVVFRLKSENGIDVTTRSATDGRAYYELNGTVEMIGGAA